MAHFRELNTMNFIQKTTLLFTFLFAFVFMSNAQTTVTNETFPNQFNSSFGSSNNSNGTFAGSTGTWTSSVNSNSLCAIAVIPAYYSASTNAIKIVNWNTTGKGAADCHAASPSVNLSSYSCAPSLDLTFKLYTYTTSASDPNSFFKVEFSNDNGTNWTSFLSWSSQYIANNYPQNGLTTVTVAIPASYRVSGFKYRFSGYKPADQANNFYLFVDDAKITATSCSNGTGSIGDRVWLDADGDGIQDASETSGLTGVTVKLRNTANAVIATTSTDGSGNYLFSNVAAGTYKVEFPITLVNSTLSPSKVGSNNAIDSDPDQSTGLTANIVLSAGQNITTVDAGYCPTTLSLGNRVWYDADNSGINNSENGIRNVTVYLYKDDNNDNVADGASIATQTTDIDGYFMFTGLVPGNYIIGAVIPNGYMSSSINGGDPDNNINLDDNGQVLVGNEIRGLAITLVAGSEPTGGGDENITYDFGMLPDCTCTNSAGNLLTNASFENGTTGWSWSGGSLTTGTGFVACGTKNGFNNWSSGTSKVWQDVTVAAGSTVTFKAFAGTHAPGISCSPKLSLIFLNSSNVVIGQTDVTVTRVVGDYHDQLEQYSISAVAPANTVKARVQSSITCNTMKLDAFCLTVILPPAVTNPDFNSTWVNIPVPGNVSTNDIIPVGTTYGTSPVLLSSPAGSIASITMNSNGTYSFTANKPGVYTYDVPVCVPGQALPCPPTKLVITVLNALVSNNAPVANVDIAATLPSTAVTLKTLANDAAGSPNFNLVPSTVTVTVNPPNGIASVNAATGDITYTPNAGFTGSDTLTYQVCDNQVPAKCATAKQIITVKPSGSANITFAADDYKITNINTAASGNVKTNDTDPEGHTQTITAQTTTIAGKGTLVLLANGSYTFTPATNYTGPVDFPYTTCDNGSPVVCATATLHILVQPNAVPDFNSTFVNVPVPGNVSTNDQVSPGTTYGTSPTLISSPEGSIASITMNSDGTYSFMADKPGVYTYDVPVCVPGQLAPCPPVRLVITVLNALVNNNAPVANLDIAATLPSTAVTLKTLANDAAGSPNFNLVPSTVTVTVNPPNGIASVNAATGDITYTPNAGFFGSDTLTYQVCDNQVPAKCATAKQIITVKPAGNGNTTSAADDYKITNINTPASGNVKTNDTDPEGNAQSVTPQNTTIAGKGTLVLAADGSYTFTPALNFTGPVDFPYTTCDNGSPVACATATLHILVQPNAVPDFNSTFVNVPVPGNVSTNDQVSPGTTYGTSPTLISSPAGSIASITMNSDGTYSFMANMPGLYTYDVPVCVPGQLPPCPPVKLVITVLNALVNNNAPVANLDIATTLPSTPVTLKTLANDAAGNAIHSLVPGTVTVTVNPPNGIASVNAATGDITYTPNAGFFGSDTLTYQVCDNQVPAKCATAKQIITVKPAGNGNTTSAADDYKITNINTPVSGNVKTNDTDPEGNAQSVTPQNTTIAGKGTLVLAADGSYTFTPALNYTGPVDFPYTTCDNGSPVACAMATLHILIRPAVPVPDLSPNITATPNIIHGTTQFNVIVDVTEVLNVPTNGSEILVRIPKDNRLTFTYNSSLTTLGGTPIQNSSWTYDGSNPFFHIFKTNVIIAAFDASSFGFVATFTPGQTQGKFTLSVGLNSGSGGEVRTDNNQDAEVLDYFIN